MKTLTLMAALLASTTAFAQQTTPPADTTTGSTTSDTTTPPSGTTNDGMRPAPSTSGQDTMTTQPSTGQPMQQPIQQPTTDPAMQQQPVQQQPTTMGSTGTAGNMTAPPAGQASYPRCSATVVDQCRQGSARESDTRGGPPARRNRRR